MVGDFGWMDSKNGVCALWHARTDTLCKATKVVGEAAFPDMCVRSACKVTVFMYRACDGIYDGVCLMTAVICLGVKVVQESVCDNVIELMVFIVVVRFNEGRAAL